MRPILQEMGYDMAIRISGSLSQIKEREHVVSLPGTTIGILSPWSSVHGAVSRIQIYRKATCVLVYH